MLARIEGLGPLQSLLFSRHPSILLILLAGAKEMDACRGMPAQPAGIPCRMPADCRHPAGIPSRYPAGIPSRHPAGIPEPLPARGGGLSAVQPRLAGGPVGGRSSALAAAASWGRTPAPSPPSALFGGVSGCPRRSSIACSASAAAAAASITQRAQRAAAYKRTKNGQRRESCES